MDKKGQIEKEKKEQFLKASRKVSTHLQMRHMGPGAL